MENGDGAAAAAQSKRLPSPSNPARPKAKQQRLAQPAGPPSAPSPHACLPATREPVVTAGLRCDTSGTVKLSLATARAWVRPAHEPAHELGHEPTLSGPALRLSREPAPAMGDLVARPNDAAVGVVIAYDHLNAALGILWTRGAPTHAFDISSTRCRSLVCIGRADLTKTPPRPSHFDVALLDKMREEASARLVPEEDDEGDEEDDVRTLLSKAAQHVEVSQGKDGRARRLKRIIADEAEDDEEDDVPTRLKQGCKGRCDESGCGQVPLGVRL